MAAARPAADARRRSRTISFRLSPKEYESLRSLSLSNGSRSISEFTRSVACRPPRDAAHARQASRLDNTLQMLNDAVAALDRHVRRLSEILDGPKK